MTKSSKMSESAPRTSKLRSLTSSAATAAVMAKKKKKSRSGLKKAEADPEPRSTNVPRTPTKKETRGSTKSASPKAKSRFPTSRLNYRGSTSPSNSTVTTDPGAMTPSPMSTASSKRSTASSVGSTTRRVKTKLVLDEVGSSGKNAKTKRSSSASAKKLASNAKKAKPKTRKENALENADSNLKEPVRKPTANEVDWTTNEGLDKGLSHFYEEDSFTEVPIREKVEMLSGCYAPQDNKMMYMVLSMEAGESPRSVNVSNLRGKKVIGKAMADIVIKVVNSRTDLNVNR